MSNLYGERGDVKTLRTISALKATQRQPQVHLTSLNEIQPHTAQGRDHETSVANFSLISSQSGLDSGTASSTTNSPPTKQLPSPDEVAQSELLQGPAFPTWNEETGSDSLETPEELQKQDPLGTQIWKLYSKTKTRLPNQERMENLTWRMMAMNLKRREREQQAAALYVVKLKVILILIS